MSDDIEQLKKRHQEDSDTERKKRILQKAKIDRDFEQQERGKAETDFFKKLDLSGSSRERLQALKQENQDYIRASRAKMPFISDVFADVVPYFARNLILIGAVSGQGKSTAAANIVLSTLLHNKKVLVITNEENANDIYNRITCLIKGWTYNNHNKITDEQIEVFNEYMDKLSEWVTVVDDKFGGATGLTTTLEGIEGLLNNLHENSVHYDAIVVDYIQNVSKSKLNPTMPKWEVLQRLVEYLNSFRNKYMAPVVMLAQLHSSSDDISFEERLKGFKGMNEVMTCAMEIRPDKKNYKSEWVVHKSRWASEINGSGFFTGWFKGRYVDENNPKYKEWVKNKIISRANALLDDSKGVMNARTTATNSEDSGSGDGDGTTEENVF